MANLIIDKTFKDLLENAGHGSIEAVSFEVKDGILTMTILHRDNDYLYLIDQDRANQTGKDGLPVYGSLIVNGQTLNEEYEDLASEAEEYGDTIDEDIFGEAFTEIGDYVAYSVTSRTVPVEAIAEEMFKELTRYPLSHSNTNQGYLLKKILERNPDYFSKLHISGCGGIAFDREDTDEILAEGKEIYDDNTLTRLKDELIDCVCGIGTIESIVDDIPSEAFSFVIINDIVAQDLKTGERSDGTTGSRDSLLYKAFDRLLQTPEMASVRDSIKWAKEWGVAYQPSKNLLVTTLGGKEFPDGPTEEITPEELVLILSGRIPNQHSQIFQFMFDFRDTTGGDKDRERILNGLLKMRPELADYDKVFDDLAQAEFEKLLNDPDLEFVCSGDRPYGLYMDSGKRFVPLEELECNQSVLHVCEARGYTSYSVRGDNDTKTYTCWTEFVKDSDGQFRETHGREAWEDVQEDCIKHAPEISTSVKIKNNKICEVLRYEGKHADGRKSSPYNPVNHGFEGGDVPNAEFDNINARAGYKTNPVRVAATAAGFFKYRDYLMEQLGRGA